MILHTYNFTEVIDSIIANAETFQFNLKDLPDVVEYTYHKSILGHPKFESIFSALNEKQTSCLYWFEFNDSEMCSSVINVLNANRERLKESVRAVPVMNKNLNSNVLYVGIRRGGQRKYDGLTNISGRIVQHLGYYKVGTTQGLQLAHWAVESGLDIKLNVIQFEEGFPDAHLEAFEKIMAHKFKPLCGKH